MKPFSTVTHSSIKPAKYALEMNHDWFVSRKITAGNKIIGLENVPDAIGNTVFSPIQNLTELWNNTFHGTHHLSHASFVNHFHHFLSLLKLRQ